MATIDHEERAEVATPKAGKEETFLGKLKQFRGTLAARDKPALTEASNKGRDKTPLDTGRFKIRPSPVPKSTKIDIVAIGNGEAHDWDWFQKQVDDTGNSEPENLWQRGIREEEEEPNITVAPTASTKEEKKSDGTVVSTVPVTEEERVVAPTAPVKEEEEVDNTAQDVLPGRKSRNWLTDPTMLPSSMPSARIMEFHYSSKGDDSGNIETTASNFLICLQKERKDCPTRPVIFVAHANGELVLEKAFVLDSPKLVPQLIQLRAPAEKPVPNQGTASGAPDEPLSPPPGSDRHKTSPANGKARKTDPVHIPPPKTLHAPSVVAGVIFLETSTDRPGKDVNFHRDFLSVIVEWDIPLRWYCSFQQSYRISEQPLFNTCMSKYKTPLLRTFSEDGEEGSLNKFSDVGDENYSRVRREIMAIFRDDRFLEAAYQSGGSATTLDKIIGKLDPTDPKRYGNTALHIVSRLGNVKAATTLLDHDMDMTTKTQSPDPNPGQTALQIALKYGQLEIIKLLLEKGTPRAEFDKEMAKSLKEHTKEGPALSEEGNKISREEIHDLLATLAQGPGGDYPSLKKDSQTPLISPVESIPWSDKFTNLEYPDLPPNPYGRKACKKYQITVVDFFVEKQPPKEATPKEAAPKEAEAAPQCKEARNVKSYSVHDVLYRKVLETDHFPKLEERKKELEVNLRTQFTWYHVPANNIAWVQGLLLKLDRQKWFRQGAIESRGETPHSRFVQPKVTVFNGDNNTPLPITLFTPFLSIEDRDNQKNMAKTISRARVIHDQIENPPDDSESTKGKSTYSEGVFNEEDMTEEASSPEELLLFGYVDQARGIHVRRTLAQSFYPMLPDTKKQDRSQTLLQHREPGDPKCVAMVDQLWLYILDDKLITSFPLRWGEVNGKGEGHDILDLLLKSLRKRQRKPIVSMFDLASVIIQRCAGLVAAQHERLPQEYDMLGKFRKAIGLIANDAANSLRKFDKTVTRLDYLRRNSYLIKLPKKNYRNSSESESSEDDSGISDTESEESDSDSDVNLNPSRYEQEVRRLEVQRANKKREKKLVQSFNHIAAETRLLIQIKDIQAELDMVISILKPQLKVIQEFAAAIPEAMKGTEHAKSLVQMREKGTKKLDKFCEMLKQSTGVDEALNHLLNLKQKQANASEAQIANKLAIETGRQGKTLMIFTAVTIIFLPASFMAAFLTIPIADYPHDDKGASAMTLHWASKYIFSISFGISIPLLILAFNFAIFENGVKNRTGPRAATHVLGRFFIRVHQWLMFLLAWIRLLLLHIWYSFLGDKNKWRRRRYRRAGRRALRRRRGIYKPYESAEN